MSDQLGIRPGTTRRHEAISARYGRPTRTTTSFAATRPSVPATTVGLPLPIVRVGAGTGADDTSCSRFERIKARVTDRIDRPRREREGLEDFLLRPVLAALDEIELQGRSRADVLDGLVRLQGRFDEPEIGWIRNAVANYPDFRDEGLVPEPGVWVRQGRAGDELRELYSWGRGYVSADRRQRVFVLLAFATATGRPAPPSKVAIAALTTAFGTASTWPAPREWPRPFRPTGVPEVRPDLVSVRQVGLLDGSIKERFEGTPDEAQLRYDRDGRAAAESVLGEAFATPGRNCDSCKIVDTCEAIHRAPGVLGINAPSAPLRKVSATTLRYHEACPRQARLHALHLSNDVQESTRIQVGRAVDGLLDAAHGTDVSGPCPSEIPADALAQDGLGPDDKVRARTLLSHHAAVCPLNTGAEISHLQVQPEVVMFDAEASVVLNAKPDLLYREDGDLVWRETTTSRSAPSGRKHPFETRKGLQLALAVLLCHGGALGEPVARIEVEYLTDRGPDLRSLDPSDPATVAAARAVVEPVAQRWREDQTFRPTPGAAVCRSCSYRQWCPEADRSEEENDE